MLKLLNTGAKPQLVPLETWPPTHAHALPLHTAPITEQTQALPTCVVLGWQLAEMATAPELALPQGLVAVASQVELPAFGAGMMAAPPAGGTKLAKSGLSPVQVTVAESAPEPPMFQLAVWFELSTMTEGGAMLKEPKEGGNPQLVALVT